ncbi:MAG TPA: thiamine-phosphate kinase [Mycobacterium sp.]|uniref:thiamine-phosphate kinase n=1 Tax=Mycolicibacterium sp. TaxID=2320850 RepID=UPI0025F964E7|nr:thiamine-phosphate kinase [Mycolicibacterium sp.]HPX35117.1 thiamine-phosphate kinase [Mycobacterium sp.]HQC75531.1 thiamine-phosphate kinase [Mycobacterium sp.]
MSDPTLNEVGEFAVIGRITAGRAQPAGVTLGPGDDAAVIAAPDGRVVVSTDMLIEGRHFRRDWSTPFEIGRKAIAQNAADIEAMGAAVTAFVVGFGAPPSTAVSEVTELSDGMWQEAAAVGAGIAGGDMVAAPQWVLSVTVLGDLGGRPPVTRAGARAGSVVAVAGSLGLSAAGFALQDNAIDGFDDIRERHRVPRPPYGQGRLAAQAGAQAMTDVSDGLLADLGHIADASGVTLDLSSDLLQTDVDAVNPAATAAGADPWSLVLGGGEDHALVACFGGAPPPGWRVIGAVRAGAAQVLVDGRAWSGPSGWQSYD